MTNEQMAELMIGMARAQIKLLGAVVGQQTVSQTGISVMQSMGEVTPLRPITFSNMFARMMLQSFGTSGPDAAFYAAELNRLTRAE